MKTISYIRSLLFLALWVPSLAQAALPFLFWLEQPKRSNPNDRKSTLFIATPAPTTPTHTPTPGPTGSFKFEDFDLGLLNGTDYNDGGGSSVTGTASSLDYVSAPNSLRLTVNTPGGWGGGVNFQTSYGAPALNMLGTLRVTFSIKADAPINFTFRFRESGTDASVANENWVSANVSLPASGAWQQVSLPLSGFSEDPYGNPACGPNCASGMNGNNSMDLGAVFSAQLQFASGISGATVLVDDIHFDTSLGGSPTASPSASPTRTASPSRTATPSSSATPSITVTFSASPTATPFAGSPTDTPVYSSTPSASPSPTPSPTVTSAPIALFEDFEGATPLNPNGYGNSLPYPSSSWDGSTAVSGTQSWLLNATTTGWGGGINIDSNNGLIDASGAQSLVFWMRSDTVLSGFTVRFRESGVPASFTDENWVSGSLNLAATGVWTEFRIPIASFSEDAYGGACQPNCHTGANGNNFMDLGAVQKFEVQFPGGLSGANVSLDDIYFDLAPPATPTPSASPTPFAGTPTYTQTPIPVQTRLFEDFEAGPLLAQEEWGDGGSGASSSQATSTAQANSGSYSNAVQITSLGYGAGVNFQSNYFNGGGYIDANGAINLVYSIRADQAFSYTVRWKEGSASENGGDLENWVSGTQNYTAVGAWQQVIVPLAGFTEDPYGDPSCAGTCQNLGSGDSNKDYQSVKRFELQVLPSEIGLNVFLDDIYFQIPAGTPTFTPTAAVPTATFTPCAPSASFGSATATGPGTYGYGGTGLVATQFSLGSAGTVVSLSVYLGNVSQGGFIQGGIYADASGAPMGLLTQSGQVAVPGAAGWFNLPLSPPMPLAAGNYWIALNSSVSDGPTSNIFRFQTTGYDYYTWGAYSGSTLPNPFSAGGALGNDTPGTGGHLYAVQANYCP